MAGLEHVACYGDRGLPRKLFDHVPELRPAESRLISALCSHAEARGGDAVRGELGWVTGIGPSHR